MDPSPSRLRATHNYTSEPTPHSAAASASGENSKLGNLVGSSLRRGHSDGDVLPGSSRSYISSEATRDGETWMDFLRHSSSVGQGTEEQARIATRKAAIIADRKRRFTGQQEEYSRRRSASSLAFGQTASDRIRQGISQPTTNHPLIVNPRAPDNHFVHRLTDRPLPPRPNVERSPDRRSRDVTLPRWQPDADVSSCPICGAHFSFWYRKHHCRKCGRVVCANCSPHRITIPRQFIVHSPQETGPYLRNQHPTDSTVIDLTDENESDARRLHSAVNEQSHDLRIDPALGGGQEVRLCNPCVPDPNPLPHLSFASPNLLSFNSFPSPENSSRMAPFMHHNEPSSSSRPQQRHSLSSRPDSYRRPNDNSSSGSAADAVSNTTFIGTSASNHRQDRIARPSNVPQHLPPNYSSIYGSAPDPSFHDVCLQSNMTTVSSLIVYSVT